MIERDHRDSSSSSSSSSRREKLRLFANHDAASRGAFRYDLLCGPRRLPAERIPECQYCRESGHIAHYCSTRRAVRDLVELEKMKNGDRRRYDDDDDRRRDYRESSSRDEGRWVRVSDDYDDD